MTLTAFRLPPGMYANGTESESAGRWRTGSLVRWRNGVMQPIHGWRTRATLPAGFKKARGSLAWRDNANDRYVAIGTANALYLMKADNTIQNITPVTPTALVPGLEEAVDNAGFGGGFFGMAGFGTPRPEGATLLEAAVWMLDNWGQDLVGCMRDDGRLWQWSPGSTEAAEIPNAPTGCSGLIATEERFLMALAPGRNPRRIQWCDQEDNTAWTPSATNLAGDWELTTTGEIVTAVRTRGQTLILTDNDAHAATFVGYPFAYSFERVGTSCGCVSRAAAVTVDRGVYWMGPQSFYHYSGGGVEEIPCEVGDAVFSEINWPQATKIHAIADASFSEVWWFYPSLGSTEPNKYVVYNYAEKFWYTGTLSRTTGVDAGAFAYPIWVGTNGSLYSNEGGYGFAGDLPWVQSGPVMLDEGERVMVVAGLVPDERTLGDTTIQFRGRFHPTGTERTYGPYSLANPTSVRFTARQVALRIDATGIANWRVGTIRLNLLPGGER